MKSKIRLRNSARGIIILIFLFNLIFAPTAWALTYTDIASEFICNCGCNLHLPSCEYMDCAVKDQLKGTINRLIKTGLGREEIVRYMKVNFREAILAAPEKKGFNLTAWITPFAAVLIGGALIYQILASWVLRRKKEAQLETASVKVKSKTTKVDKKYSEKLEKELKDFGGY